MELDDADLIVTDKLRHNPAIVIQRYVARHRLRRDRAVSADMVLHHWRTESRLSRQLRQSDPTNRFAQFADAYGQFYRELFWLNDWKEDTLSGEAAIAYGYLTRILGPVRDVYEVGSGKGELIEFLASKGYRCIATEITTERGRKWDAGSYPNLEWKSSDGVHLSDYEEYSCYDAVISNQVVEHIHPDDLAAHFTHVARILRPGGRYLVSTPHKYGGPADVSAIFDFDEPLGFHLHEYTNTEVIALGKQAGFSSVEAVYVTPQKLRRLLLICFSSRWYLDVLIVLEAVMRILPHRLRKRMFRSLLATAILRRDVFLCLRK